MKVKELRRQLGRLSPDEEIFLSADEEGNTIYPIQELVELEAGQRSYFILYPTSTPEEILEGEPSLEEAVLDILRQQPNVLALWKRTVQTSTDERQVAHCQEMIRIAEAHRLNDP